MHAKMRIFLLATVPLLLAACARRDEASQPDLSASTENWLGQWNGPEGTFLRLSGAAGKYEIVIQDLDGPQIFEGHSRGDHIEFERNGVTESIRATTGAETGMKWLSEKSDCLTIKPGEGYCRD